MLLVSGLVGIHHIADFHLRVTPTTLDCLTHAASLQTQIVLHCIPLLTEQPTLCIDCKLFPHVQLSFYRAGETDRMCGCYRLSRREQIIEEHFVSISGEKDWNHGYNIARPSPCRSSASIQRNHAAISRFIVNEDGYIITALHALSVLEPTRKDFICRTVERTPRKGF